MNESRYATFPENQVAVSLAAYIIYALFAVSEILISRLFRSNASDPHRTDAHSLTLIWVVAVLSLLAAVWVALNFYWPIYQSTAVTTIGLTLMGIGIGFRWAVIASLGRLFTADVAIRESHTLKTSGFYRFLRHPSYTALALTFIGFGVSLNNWVALLLVLIPIIPALLNRIRIEEKTLIAHFGATYVAYMARTKALIPFVY